MVWQSRTQVKRAGGSRGRLDAGQASVYSGLQVAIGVLNLALKLIIDTDPGIDDALALALLTLSPEVDIHAVTAANGNLPAEECLRNIHRIYGFLRVENKPIIGVGREWPRSAEDARHIHGRDGLANTWMPAFMRNAAEPAGKLIASKAQDEAGDDRRDRRPPGNANALCPRILLTQNRCMYIIGDEGSTPYRGSGAVGSRIRMEPGFLVAQEKVTEHRPRFWKGEHTVSRFGPCAVVILALSCAAQGSWAYDYQDDFSTNKAMTDSYDHSVFWPETALPPAEPYLFYTSVSQPAGRLAFAKFPDTGIRAHLAYCFPLGESGPDSITGTMEFDVYEYATGAYMAFSMSPDGTTWTLPTPISPPSRLLPPGLTATT